MVGSNMSDTLVVCQISRLPWNNSHSDSAEGAETYAENLVALAKLTAQVSRSSSQDEGDEDALTILAAHDIEAEAGGAALHANPAGLAGVVVLSQHAAGDGRVAARRRRGEGLWVIAHVVGLHVSCDERERVLLFGPITQGQCFSTNVPRHASLP